ncbi:MAG: hypothetical protein GM46_9300 [actinobacterium acAcidi]|nr:MAG: hypothetical protein GM46_9300 [actinobacterium acAcidi]
MLSLDQDQFGIDQLNLGLLILRLVLGLFLAYHGYNKVFGKGGLSGTASWFASMGMKWPKWQARAAAATEIGAGVMLAVGLLTPLAAAGVIGVMVVAIYTSHLKATIALGALAVGTMGPGEWSLDNAIDFSMSGWSALVVTIALGVGGAVVQLATSYRPAKKS